MKKKTILNFTFFFISLKFCFCVPESFPFLFRAVARVFHKYQFFLTLVKIFAFSPSPGFTQSSYYLSSRKIYNVIATRRRNNLFSSQNAWFKRGEKLYPSLTRSIIFWIIEKIEKIKKNGSNIHLFRETIISTSLKWQYRLLHYIHDPQYVHEQMFFLDFSC